ncbi:MAG: biotin--[acetyl-CoA-carboxylase] ligase [Bacteroidota bacterium]
MKKQQLIGAYIIRMETVSSTNQYASETMKNELFPEGTVIWALNQTQGKGQKGNYWESEKGKNLLLSIILYPDYIKASSQFVLNKIISLGVAEFIQSLTKGVSIKWPNDIYVDNKKIAGILIENRIMGDSIQSSIIGIGININQIKFISDAPNPISLFNITNKEYELKECLQSLCNYLNKWYGSLLRNEFELIDSSYLNLLKNYNIFSKYLYKGIEIEAQIKGVTEYGKLIIETQERLIIECDLKEITFLFN